jgi:hypothetical protein
MYLVHQIIVCILYAILCIVFSNRRHMGEEGVITSTVHEENKQLDIAC